MEYKEENRDKVDMDMTKSPLSNMDSEERDNLSAEKTQSNVMDQTSALDDLNLTKE